MRCPVVWLAVLAAPATAQDPTDPVEKQAAAEVAKLGGRVKVDKKDPTYPVVGVNLNGAQIEDKDLKCLESFKKVREIVAGGSLKVTDAGVKHFKKLDGLEELVLSYTGVTDAGLKHLAELKRLDKLVLDSTAVTDAGLKELEKLKTLKFLYVGDTKVTAEGIAALKKANPGVKVFK